MLDMINPQRGINLMNNNSIINRILFVVTIFQHEEDASKENYKNDMIKAKRIIADSIKDHLSLKYLLRILQKICVIP
jgi:hypothetical protein